MVFDEIGEPEPEIRNPGVLFGREPAAVPQNTASSPSSRWSGRIMSAPTLFYLRRRDGLADKGLGFSLRAADSR